MTSSFSLNPEAVEAAAKAIHHAMGHRHPPWDSDLYRDEMLRLAEAALASNNDGEIRERAELAFVALLPLLPLEGSERSGYRISEYIDPTVRALPEEWADAAHAVAELRAALSAQRAGEPPTPDEVERAAKAMEAHQGTPNPNDYWRDKARAALDAARQPEGEAK